MPDHPIPDGPAHAALLQGLAGLLDLRAGALSETGTTVVGLEARTGSRRCSIYHNGLSTTLWCDPSVVARVDELLDGFDRAISLTIDHAEARFAGGASHEGRGLIHVLAETGICPSPPPAGFAAMVVDPTNPDDMAVFRQLVDANPDDDLDAAEIDINEPDPHIEFLVDPAGRPAAYGSWIPWDSVPAFVDIGVVTTPTDRQAGLGRAVVANVTQAALDQGFHPLYRCDGSNEASRRLAESVGFVSVYELSAWHFDLP